MEEAGFFWPEPDLPQILGEKKSLFQKRLGTESIVEMGGGAIKMM